VRHCGVPHLCCRFCKGLGVDIIRSLEYYGAFWGFLVLAIGDTIASYQIAAVLLSKVARDGPDFGHECRAK
jgi:hypothetical protein